MHLQQCLVGTFAYQKGSSLPWRMSFSVFGGFKVRSRTDMAASRYRNFLRLCEDWPLDKSKIGRDLGAFLREKVALAFKHGEATNVNLQECDRMYETLHRINTNYYKTKYSRSGVMTTGAVGITVEDCSLIVSTEGLKVTQEEDVGIFGRLKKKLASKD